ncbi:hypothetical protein CISIN_1g044886mg [Citrus sinensis]|uniref:NADP-dependent oxidoreductase domain-containing protein n=1 Tax=Citrus sinensis TaxID=2711 RepID=A0A067D0K2_CITSI|nr:hypothetical protein CISIN_1g044886mg [Citrus sinensis]
MSAFYGPSKPESGMIALTNHAIDSGINVLDTSDVYGPHTNEILLGKVIYEDGKYSYCGDPAYLRAACEASLKRLDVDCIDLYDQHRIDTKVPIEVTIGELKRLVEEGKIKHIDLSEAFASTIRRAHTIHPITVVRLEWSLRSRDVKEEMELGIGIVAYNLLECEFLSSGPKLIHLFATKGCIG